MTRGLSVNLDDQFGTLTYRGGIPSWNIMEINMQLIKFLNPVNLHFPGYTIHCKKVKFQTG